MSGLFDDKLSITVTPVEGEKGTRAFGKEYGTNAAGVVNDSLGKASEMIKSLTGEGLQLEVPDDLKETLAQCFQGENMCQITLDINYHPFSSERLFTGEATPRNLHKVAEAMNNGALVAAATRDKVKCEDNGTCENSELQADIKARNAIKQGLKSGAER